MADITKRVTQSGEARYRARVRVKGFPVESATFRRKTDAERWYRQTKAAMEEGRHFKTAEAKRHTLGELIDRYIRDVLPQRPKSRANYETQLGWWKEEIGERLLADVTSVIIAECRDKLAAGKSSKVRLKPEKRFKRRHGEKRQKKWARRSKSIRWASSTRPQYTTMKKCRT